MKDKKLQVFVSSTYTDLREERQAAVEAILSSGNIPAGMELFAAGDESQMTVIERWIDESDVYLLILGGRYGSIEPKSGKSYTHLEYEYAMSKGKPLFAMVINTEALDNKVRENGLAAVEKDNSQKLNDFRNLVTRYLVKFWDDKKDIKIAIHETLADIDHRKELIGWIRGNNTVNTGAVVDEITRLTKENADLREKVSHIENNTTNLYSNLTYEQLESILKKEEVNMGTNKQTLFDFIIEIGPELPVKARFKGSDVLHALRRLVSFRIFETKDGTAYFTDTGAAFYLKALYNVNNSKEGKKGL